MSFKAGHDPCQKHRFLNSGNNTFQKSVKFGYDSFQGHVFIKLIKVDLKYMYKEL